MKILISGGHLTPALAFIDYLDQQQPAPEIVFVGRLYSKINNQQRSKEYEEVDRRKHRFISLNTGKLTRLKLVPIMLQSGLFLQGLLSSFQIMATQRPDVFVSFGGYLAVPLAIAAWLWGVPIVTHEQTHTLGVANTFIGKLAKRVALSYPERRAGSLGAKAVVTGNLIRPTVLREMREAPTWFDSDLKRPVLYITGGSQGSEILNTTIAQTVKRLTKSWTVIHQCGMNTTKRDYRAELDAVRQTLTRAQKSSYYIREWISESELAWIYTVSSAIISRSGANTTEEIARRAVPSILIPLPFSRHQEQLENARALTVQKAALLIQQKQLTPTLLLEKLQVLQSQRASMKENLKALTFIENPAERLWEVVQAVIKK